MELDFIERISAVDDGFPIFIPDDTTLAGHRRRWCVQACEPKLYDFANYTSTMPSTYTRKPQDGILPFLTSQMVPAAVALMVMVRIMPAFMRKPCSKKPAAHKVSKVTSKNNRKENNTYQHHHQASVSWPPVETRLAPKTSAPWSCLTQTSRRRFLMMW